MYNRSTKLVGNATELDVYKNINAYNQTLEHFVTNKTGAK